MGRGEYDAALQKQNELMSKYYPECREWIMGIRRLIEIGRICLH